MKIYRIVFSNFNNKIIRRINFSNKTKKIGVTINFYHSLKQQIERFEKQEGSIVDYNAKIKSAFLVKQEKVYDSAVQD